MTDETVPDDPLPPMVALPAARDPLLPLTTNVARNTMPPHSMLIEHPISFQAFREITNFIRDNGDDWEEFYASTYTTPAIKKTATKTKTSKKQTKRLPHPCSLDVLPSPTDKWSATTHPIKALVIGYLGYHISYKHFFFHQSRVLLTKAFAPSTTTSTVGDGGTPRGSTELDAICGSNCHMGMEEFRMFAYLVLGLRPAKQHETEPNKRSLLNMLLLGTEPSERSLLNMLLEDFVVISNLTAVFALDEPDDRRTLARRLARFSLLLLGADALTPKIVARVWGENEVVRRNLGGPRGDLALVRRRLISLASVANNTFHLWLTTTINGGIIIPPDALQHLPPGVRDIFQLISLTDAAIYVREPLHSGRDRIHILQNNLRQNPYTPLSSNFEDIIVGWYHDLLLGGNHSMDSTGVENHIFAAYGLYTPTP